MLSADASSSEAAFVQRSDSPATPTAIVDLPFRPGHRWQGTYICSQGKSTLVLTVEGIGGDGQNITLDALFEFAYDGRGNAGYAAASGSARMQGAYDPKTRRLRFEGGEWIEQPPNYGLVTLVGSLNKTTGAYIGTVEGPGCTSFTALPTGDLPRSLPRPGP